MRAVWDVLVWLAPYAVTAYFVLIVCIVILLALRGHSERAHFVRRGHR